MAKHVKKTENSKAKKVVKIASLSAAIVAVVAIVVTLLVQTGALAQLPAMVKAWNKKETKPQVSSEDSSAFEPEVVDPSEEETPEKHTYSFPAELKGVWLVAGKDYMTSDKDTAATVQSQIDQALKDCVGWKMNTVILPLSAKGKTLFPSSVSGQLTVANHDSTKFDPIAYCLQQAKKLSLNVYGVIDCRVSGEGSLDPAVPEQAAKIITMAKEAASLYNMNGFLLENYSYAAGKTGSYASYMEQAAGMGFPKYVAECLQSTMTKAKAAVQAERPEAPVGLMANAVWAHSIVNKEGSQTTAGYEDLTDGQADTLSWLKAGMLDFVMVRDETSLTNAGMPFEKVAQWWNMQCGKLKLPLFISHAADKAGTQEAGWTSPDQLSRQVLACQGNSSWKGSAFRSYSALKKNVDGSTDALLKVYEGSIQQEYISRSLIVSSLSSTNVTTMESTVSLQGSCDPNFPLTINGKNIALTKHGYFAVDSQLVPGNNRFVFCHKGQTKTYTVFYKVVVIKSWSPTKDMKIEGDSSIVFSAIARKNASLYVTFNGKKISMKPAGAEDTESTDSEDSNFCKYACSVDIPKGIIGKTQSLGKVKFYGSFSGSSEVKTGGSVTVNAVPKPTTTTTQKPTTGSGSTTGTTSPATPSNPGSGSTVLKTGTIVYVKNEYAETFSGSTTDDYSRPVNSYLPKSTTDVKVKTVYDTASTGYGYYLLGCGRRVYMSDVTTYQTNGKLTANSITVKSTTVTNSHTTIRLGSSWHVPYNVSFEPQEYSYGSGQPAYVPKNNTLTGTYLDVTFSYTTAVHSRPNLEGNPLISRAEWISGANNTKILRLHLKKAGAYYGYTACWNSDGTMSLVLKNSPYVAGNSSSQPLKGVTVMLDPGHGDGKDSGAISGNLTEAALVLNYAEDVKGRLEAMGATVIMTRTTNSNGTTMALRMDKLRRDKPDLFLSIHMDSAGSSASGASSYYFNEYSYILAQTVYDNVHAVEKQHSIGNRYGNPVHWKTLYVTRTASDCPSALLECGFISNPANKELLINANYQHEMAQAIADGIASYFKSRPQYRAASGNYDTGSPATSSSSQTTTTINYSMMAYLPVKKFSLMVQQTASYRI